MYLHAVDIKHKKREMVPFIHSGIGRNPFERSKNIRWRRRRGVGAAGSVIKVKPRLDPFFPLPHPSGNLAYNYCQAERLFGF